MNKQPPQRAHEIVPVTSTGSERVNYALVGRGPGADMGHGNLRFGTHEEAMEHMEQHGLVHYAGRPRTNLGDDPSQP